MGVAARAEGGGVFVAQVGELGGRHRSGCWRGGGGLVVAVAVAPGGGDAGDGGGGEMEALDAGRGLVFEDH